MMNNRPLIKEVPADIREEHEGPPEANNPEVAQALADLFDNEIEHLLLLIDLAYMRTCIFMLLNKLQTLAS